jgi:hypothetical protein
MQSLESGSYRRTGVDDDLEIEALSVDPPPPYQSACSSLGTIVEIEEEGEFEDYLTPPNYEDVPVEEDRDTRLDSDDSDYDSEEF